MTGWPKRIYSIGYRRTPCMSENDGRAKKASFFLIHSLTSSLKRLHTYIVHTRIYIHVHVHMLLFSVNVRGERDMCVCVCVSSSSHIRHAALIKMNPRTFLVRGKKAFSLHVMNPNTAYLCCNMFFVREKNTLYIWPFHSRNQKYVQFPPLFRYGFPLHLSNWSFSIYFPLLFDWIAFHADNFEFKKLSQSQSRLYFVT